MSSFGVGEGPGGGEGEVVVGHGCIVVVGGVEIRVDEFEQVIRWRCL